MLRRKTRLSWNETHSLLALIRALLEVRPLAAEIHESVLALAERYRFSIYDAMIVASALSAECNILWSEDMQAGIQD